MPKCFGLLRRRLEGDDWHGTRAYIRVLQMLEHHSLTPLTDAVDYEIVSEKVRTKQAMDPDSAWIMIPNQALAEMVRKECLVIDYCQQVLDLILSMREIVFQSKFTF